MELSLTQEQRRVAHAAATEDTRPVLTAVCVRGGKLIAADGFVLAETKLDEKSQPGETDVLIPAKDMLKTKDCKAHGRAFFTMNGENRVNIIDNEGERVVNTVTGTFPNTDQLYPKGEPILVTGISYAVLATVLKVIGKDGIARLTFYDANSPIKFEVVNSDTETQGAFMPCAVQGAK